MTSEAQVEANQQNAQLSTGPKTTKGKEVVASNAIKHGIFTKALIVSSARGKEDEGEYLDMLSNLIDCLNPQNQMESLLVEKIAVDFWRLRRVLRFESGSISDYIETIFKAFYSYGKKNNEAIDVEIQKAKDYILWIAIYSACLKRGDVTFDQPIWTGDEIASNILDDFYFITKTLETVPYQEREKLFSGGSFGKIKEVLSQNGYSTGEAISAKLLEIYPDETRRVEREIKELEQKRVDNLEADRLNTLLGSIPQQDNTDKILKYERSIQKSIFQNLILLKKLQGAF